MKKLRSALAAAVLLLAGTALAPAASAAGTEDNPIVACEDSDNEIDTNFTSGKAAVKQSVWHGCASASHPQIVLGVVQPRPGTVTGTPASAAINVPDWTIVFYDAEDDIVTQTTTEMDFTYTGPIPNEMLTTMTSSSPLQEGVHAGGGTGTRTCETSDLCTYYNLSVSGMIGIDE